MKNVKEVFEVLEKSEVVNFNLPISSLKETTIKISEIKAQEKDEAGWYCFFGSDWVLVIDQVIDIPDDNLDNIKGEIAKEVHSMLKK